MEEIFIKRIVATVLHYLQNLSSRKSFKMFCKIQDTWMDGKNTRSLYSVSLQLCQCHATITKIPENPLKMFWKMLLFVMLIEALFHQLRRGQILVTEKNIPIGTLTNYLPWYGCLHIFSTMCSVHFFLDSKKPHQTFRKI